MAGYNFSQMTVGDISKLDRDSVLMAWNEANSALQAAKLRELQLRGLAFNLCFPDPKEGTNNFQLGSGWLLKADYKFNYTIQDSDAMQAALNRLSSGVAERLVRFKPEVRSGEFKQLGDADKKIIEPFVSVKPGTPSLEILKPGAEGNKRA